MDFLKGVGLQVWTALQREVLPRRTMGLPSVWPLKSDCHDVAPHLAVAIAP